jgi:hypothetical protein
MKFFHFFLIQMICFFFNFLISTLSIFYFLFFSFSFIFFLEVLVFFFFDGSFFIRGIIDNVLIVWRGTLLQLKVWKDIVNLAVVCGRFVDFSQRK